MSNELIERLVGKRCEVVTHSGSYTGSVKSVNENWLCLTDSKNAETLLNLEYVQSIKEKTEKAK